GGGSFYDTLVDERGQTIAFSADAPFSPTTDPNYDPQSFLWRQRYGVSTLNATSAPGTITVHPAMSGDGRTVVFASNGDPLGTHADGNVELFLPKVATGATSQLTFTSGCDNGAPYIGGTGPAISRDGRRIVFTSSCDLAGSNPDQVTRPFLYDTLSPGV